MKIWLSLLLVFSFTTGISQTNCDSLEIVDSLKLELIYKYKDKISKQDTVIKSLEDKMVTLESIIAKQEVMLNMDTMTFSAYDRQINLLERNIDLYLDHIEKTRPRWYESKIIYFVGGAATIFGSSWIVKNVK
ncbi:MAG TPA: hypothetical protein DF712_02720 [Balneola sp.]|nr:hypothetical protein [Balneola sp.]